MPKITTYEPTPSERQSYWDFTSQIINSLPRRDLPAVLWHYTRGTTLINIIESHSLWSTQISCLNDQREIRQASEVLRDALLEFKATNNLSSDDDFFFQRSTALLKADSPAKSWWFAACLSAVADDLSQWRAYSGGEGGYAVGFKATELALLARADNIFLAPVYYDHQTHQDVARKVAAGTFRFFREGNSIRDDRSKWTDAFLKAWTEAITYLAPIVKHHKFSAEQEWRLVRQLKTSDFQNMKYRQEQMMMSRHLPLSALAKPHSTKAGSPHLLPIAEIMVGPSRHKEISQVSVGDLLMTNGYADAMPLVTLSEVPFQTR